MIEKIFTHPGATKTKELKLTKAEWEEGYPFDVKWPTSKTNAYSKTGFAYRYWSGYFNVRFYSEEIEPPKPPVPKEIPEETIRFWIDRGYDWDEANKIAIWVKFNKMTPSPSKIREIITVVYKYKKLPSPPPEFTKKAVELYQRLDKAIDEDDKTEGWKILKEMSKTEMSPIVVIAAIAGIVFVVTTLVTWLGSVAFAKFLMEETLQTLDFAIFAASKDEDWAGMAKALAKKKEVLDVTLWENIISVLPGINVISAAHKFIDASKVKFEIDKRSWESKVLASGVNPNIDIEAAAAAIERGEDPTQFLPKAETIVIPEVISGEVTGVIDGDTIDVRDMLGHVFRIRLIGIDAPEFRTTEGKASGKFLTDLIHGKRVNVKVDPENQKDKYDRVLGVVFKEGVDINRKMLEEGYANYYFIGSSKYYSDDDYKEASKRRGKVKIYSKPTYSKIFIDQHDTHKLAIETFELSEGTYVFGVSKEGYRAESRTITVIPDEIIEVRFELEASTVETPSEKIPPEIPVEVPEVVPEVPPVEVVEFKIYITSTPANAKLFIDDVYTHHRTPSNERELKDVMELLTPGKHKIKVTKAGLLAEKVVTLTSGDNGTIHLVLETIGLPPPEVPPPELIPPEVPVDIGTLFKEMLALTEDRKVITRREVEDLMIVHGVV